MTILITGSSGFLGKNLKKILRENKKNFITVSRNQDNKKKCIFRGDLCNKNLIKRFENKIEVVVHLANKYDNGDATNTVDIFKANLIYGIEILN